MKRCPITYQAIDNDEIYSREGLKKIHRNLVALNPLEYSAEEQRQAALIRSGKMSIAGVQPKLSLTLRIKEGRFAVVDSHGTYILKPPHADYPELPENEDVTMHMAAKVGIEVPFHCLIYGKDHSLSYLIRRFDRLPRTKLSVEDFAQLTNQVRDTKYSSSMEKVVDVVTNFCTFPMIEKIKLFERVLFCFITGNEDMHLKNFSLITRDEKIELAPGYDFLNTTICSNQAKEEIALPLGGKKSRLSRKLLVDYFGRERLALSDKLIHSVLSKFREQIPPWQKLISESFLSADMQERYQALLKDRANRIL